jgi:hypothetical protein
VGYLLGLKNVLCMGLGGMVLTELYRGQTKLLPIFVYQVERVLHKFFARDRPRLWALRLQNSNSRIALTIQKFLQHHA